MVPATILQRHGKMHMIEWSSVSRLAFIEFHQQLDAVATEASLSGDEARALARIGLANYFTGMLLLPFGPFLAAAENCRYDIKYLSRRFSVGFETVCHHLSTLQRPSAKGVPFFFVRAGRAGNISKRQSATDFHFSRFGGTCPLWNFYEALSVPGRILTQLAQMPEGCTTYLWVAFTVTYGGGTYRSPGKTFAISLG